MSAACEGVTTAANARKATGHFIIQIPNYKAPPRYAKTRIAATFAAKGYGGITISLKMELGLHPGLTLVNLGTLPIH
jgi:hypothetical protein